MESWTPGPASVSRRYGAVPPRGEGTGARQHRAGPSPARSRAARRSRPTWRPAIVVIYGGALPPKSALGRNLQREGWSGRSCREEPGRGDAERRALPSAHRIARWAPRSVTVPWAASGDAPRMRTRQDGAASPHALCGRRPGSRAVHGWPAHSPHADQPYGDARLLHRGRRTRRQRPPAFRPSFADCAWMTMKLRVLLELVSASSRNRPMFARRRARVRPSSRRQKGLGLGEEDAEQQGERGRGRALDPPRSRAGWMRCVLLFLAAWVTPVISMSQFERARPGFLEGAGRPLRRRRTASGRCGGSGCAPSSKGP